ncbi:MAG: TonB-dependent receptor [Sphingobium sp.]
MGIFLEQRHLLAYSAAVIAMMPVAANAQSQIFQFNIGSQPLDNALRMFAKTTRQQILFDGDLVRGKRSAALIGSYTSENAMHLLLVSSNLQAIRGTHGAYIIKAGQAAELEQRPIPQKIDTPAQLSAPESDSLSKADGSDQNISDIVVTATRRTETLSRVPLSVVASTQATLDKQGVRSIEDLTRLTPSVTFTPDAHLPGLTNITIRGIQSTSGVPTTGIYIDDTPVQVRRGTSPVRSNPYPQIFDLDRVEVLRGPQGTLFGTGSVGGAIRFITPEPLLSGTSFYGRAEVSTIDHGNEGYEIGAAASAPIIVDKLGFRISAWHRHEGGYIDRLDQLSREVVDKDIDFTNAYTARVAMGWQPVPDLTITPSVFFQDTFDSDQGIYEVNASDPSKNQFRNGVSKIQQTYKDRWYLPALKVSLDIGNITLYSNTSYFARKSSSVSDDVITNLATFAGVVGPLPQEFAGNTDSTLATARQRVFTQELRLQNNNPSARFNWVVGLFYSRSLIREFNDARSPELLAELNYGVPPVDQAGSVADIFDVDLYNGVSGFYSTQRVKDTDKSIFAQFDYKLTDRLKFTAGARYSISKFKQVSFDTGPFSGTDGQVTRLGSSVKPLSPKFGVSYQATPKDLFYVNVAKGVRAGDLAGTLPTNCETDAALLGFDRSTNRLVDSDSVWSYEVGSKNRLFGGRLTIDASAYRIDWKNVQSLLRLGCGQYTTLNFGNARSEGFDIQLSANPTRGLQLGASISYTKARYTSELPGSVVNGDGSTTNVILRRKGEPFDLAPWSIYLNGEYEFQALMDRAYVRADFAYTSHNKKPINTGSPIVDPDILRAAATSNLDLRVGLRFSGVDLSLFLGNALNNHPVLARFHDTIGTGEFRAITTRPRTIGLTATIRK